MNIDTLNMSRLTTTQIPFSSTAVSPSFEGNATDDFARRLQNAQSQKMQMEQIQRMQKANAASKDASGGRTPSIVTNKEFYESCLELEGFLVKNLLKSMRSTVQRTNLIDIGFAGEVYEDMLYDEYAASLTRNAGFGFAEMIYRHYMVDTQA